MALENVKGVILDLDGVLFEGGERIGDIKKSFETLNSLDIPVVIATNNSSRNAQHCVDLLDKAGVNISVDQVISSATVTVNYLKKHFSSDASLFVIGSDVLKQLLRESGFQLLPDISQNADVVVVGIDRGLSYEKLKSAAIHIGHGAQFIATNDDRAVMTAQGLAPAAGAIVAAIETTTAQKPIVMGKPYGPMFEDALSILGTPPEMTLMVGDQLETDIKGAQQMKCLTALVLSGVSTEAQAKEWLPKVDLISENLNGVVEALAKEVTEFNENSIP